MRKANAWVLLLFTLSGTSALIYQIVWIRMLSHLLGGTTFAISLVLAAFMGGLAWGSRHFGQRADATERPLRLYAHLEFGIAGLGGLAFALILLAPPVYVALAQQLPAAGLGFLRGVLAFLLLIPPTFLMGGTLPVLSRYVVRSRQQLGNDLGVLYAVNTFGAVLGSFLAGYVLVAAFGVYVSIVIAVVLNALIGVLMLQLDRGLPAVPVVREAASGDAAGGDKRASRGSGKQAETTPEIGWFLLAVLFACSGFAALGYEIYWTRALQLFLGNSTYAYSAMLTTFLLGLSVGGWFGGFLVGRVEAPSRLLGLVQWGIGASVVASVFLIWSWLPTLQLSNLSMGWNSYLAVRFLVAAAIMAVPTFLIGMTFPIINHIGIGSLARLGRGVGFLYYSNTLGAILGSLAGGFLLLPWLGAKGALLVTATFNGIIGLAAILGSRRRRGFDLGLAGAGALVVLALALGARSAGVTILSDTQLATDRVLYQREDHAAETRVYQKLTGDMHMSVDGHHIGGTDLNILRKEKILAHLPMALAPHATRTLSIGLGSGTTLGTLALYPQLQQIDCVEIVPGVVEGAAYFHQTHGNVLQDARVDITVGDGVQYLLTTAHLYDVISSDSKLNPEYSGNAPLLSLDYYELCRDRLTDNGIMAQWLVLNTPPSELQSITRSFQKAFPHSGLFWYDPYNIILVGSRQPLSLDVLRVASTGQHGPLQRDLQSLQLENPYVYASLFVAGDQALRTALGDGPINTWMRPRLEFTLLREYRRQPSHQSESDNLKWMLRARDAEALQFAGKYDPGVVDMFQQSGESIMRAFAVDGGIERLDTGVTHLEAAAEINPLDRRAVYWQQMVSSAAQALEQAAAAGQVSSAEDLVRLGLARSDAGRYAEALTYYDRALAMRPKDSNIQYNRLVVLRQLGRGEALERSLRTFRADFPNDARGYSVEGRLLASRGDFEGALALFLKAEESSPENAVFVNNVATSLARLERNAEAGERFARIVEIDPSFPHAAYFAAASFSKAGRTEEAARWMQYCLDNELSERSKFEQEGFFANLRASEHWIP